VPLSLLERVGVREDLPRLKAHRYEMAGWALQRNTGEGHGISFLGTRWMAERLADLGKRRRASVPARLFLSENRLLGILSEDGIGIIAVGHSVARQLP
jgi:hypothetical protein